MAEASIVQAYFYLWKLSLVIGWCSAWTCRIIFIFFISRQKWLSKENFLQPIFCYSLIPLNFKIPCFTSSVLCKHFLLRSLSLMETIWNLRNTVWVKYLCNKLTTGSREISPWLTLARSSFACPLFDFCF